MKLPQVNPVGLLENPDDYRSTPRKYRPLMRWGAAALLATFVFVSLVTSVSSLAAYCLTSYAGMPFAFAG